VTRQWGVEGGHPEVRKMEVTRERTFKKRCTNNKTSGKGVGTNSHKPHRPRRNAELEIAEEGVFQRGKNIFEVY